MVKLTGDLCIIRIISIFWYGVQSSVLTNDNIVALNHDLSTQALKINVNHTWVTDDACSGLVKCLKFGVQNSEIINLM